MSTHPIWLTKLFFCPTDRIRTKYFFYLNGIYVHRYVFQTVHNIVTDSWNLRRLLLSRITLPWFFYFVIDLHDIYRIASKIKKRFLHDFHFKFGIFLSPCTNLSLASIYFRYNWFFLLEPMVLMPFLLANEKHPAYFNTVLLIYIGVF